MKHVRVVLFRMACALLAIMLMVGFDMSALAATKGDVLSVSQDYARLRAAPKSGSDVLARLRKGSKVIFLSEDGGWVKLELSNGKRGYMYKSMLASYSAPKVGKIYRSRLRSGKLAVYAKANAKSKKKGMLKSSTSVVLLERRGLWGLVRVIKNGQVGFVNIKHLKPYK